MLLYAELGDGATTARNETTRERLSRASAALFDEHLWSWAPGYLRAVAPLGGPAVAAWAGLTAEFLGRERASWGPPAQLPLALREAPAPLSGAEEDQDVLLDALVAPVRCGVVLSHTALARCARLADVGYRRGERRFALKAMLAQSPARVLPALAAAVRRAAEPGGTGRADVVQQWWADRAAATARVLDRLAAGAVSDR